MDKAQKVLRRSSIRLKSISSGHAELNMIVSDVDHMRGTAKAFLRAQQTLVEDLMDWANKEKNLAIQETLALLAELSLLWSETQKDFIDQLKTFKLQFDMILEGERSVDKIRAQLTAYEQKASKLKKDLQKNSVSSVDETKRVESKLDEVKLSISRAQVEVSEQVSENEVVKLIRLKEGLSKLSDYYLELAFKCNAIFDAHRAVVAEIPAGQEKSTNIQNIIYTGSKFSKAHVLQAKEKVKNYKQSSAVRSTAPYDISSSDKPPPYSPNIAQDGSFTSVRSSFGSPAGSSVTSPLPVSEVSQDIYTSHRYDHVSETVHSFNPHLDEVNPDSMRYENIAGPSTNNERYHNIEPLPYGFRTGTPTTIYEQNVAGAMTNMTLK
ncbi:unnamed protein product [Bemisia tabaci]|uniref:Uncharacterized protein n=1 Tax=Bemisia tabaci TaxID=7038 RepID=A0A9P0EY13_BEMTA|nr:PREDICTED: uncharacterized protein LOC109035549 [Bemisia tabaci]XP_018904764.1 PREDICTED: uncharacterized protein LOC109035549 [Bemisia tabaci]XP_018904765.1 PREDICTED: uncharacterized protein LOC109035549 [Bemisia tabaci]CAH0381650.1 unnamed protein product [Bemisia tabaci]